MLTHGTQILFLTPDGWPQPVWPGHSGQTRGKLRGKEWLHTLTQDDSQAASSPREGASRVVCP